jgi:hypothetical protein
MFGPSPMYSLHGIQNLLMKWALTSRLALFSAKEATSEMV